jgi:hypothetical protein
MKVNLRFGGAYCFHLQGEEQVKKQASMMHAARI